MPRWATKRWPWGHAEPPLAQILVVVANTQVSALRAKLWRRVPCQQPLHILKSQSILSSRVVPLWAATGGLPRVGWSPQSYGPFKSLTISIDGHRSRRSLSQHSRTTHWAMAIDGYRQTLNRPLASPGRTGPIFPSPMFPSLKAEPATSGGQSCNAIEPVSMKPTESELWPLTKSGSWGTSVDCRLRSYPEPQQGSKMNSLWLIEQCR